MRTESLRISRILHAGYLFESKRTKILFDPIFETPFSVNCQAFPAIQFNEEELSRQKFDAVFISHFHEDHCSLESLDFLDRETPIYLFCVYPELFEMIRALGFTQVHAMSPGQTIAAGEMRIRVYRALDADVDSILAIQYGDVNILNVVDSWIDDEVMRDLAQTSWDLILWPSQTMREMEVICPALAEPASRDVPSEWIEQLQVLKPRFVVPSACQFRMEDWSWYNQAFFPISRQSFTRAVRTALPETLVQAMPPGSIFELSEQGFVRAGALSWIRTIGDQDADYEYDDAQIPMPSSEIAKKFSALNDSEKNRVLDFCGREIMERYSSLSEADGFFEKPRLWELIVYDHEGEPKSWFYRVAGTSMTLESRGVADWRTEIPCAKLEGALSRGESLTSIYLRIHPGQGTAEDLLQDPLLRTLYEGRFAEYQRCQLERIQRQG